MNVGERTLKAWSKAGLMGFTRTVLGACATLTGLAPQPAAAGAIQIVITNPEVLAEQRYGTVGTAIGSVLYDLPAEAHATAAAEIASRLEERRVNDLVIAESGEFRWGRRTDLLVWQGGELRLTTVEPGVYNGIVVTIPDELALARREKGRLTVAIGRMLMLKVKKRAVEAVAEEVVRGLSEEGAEFVFTVAP